MNELGCELEPVGAESTALRVPRQLETAKWGQRAGLQPEEELEESAAPSSKIFL